MTGREETDRPGNCYAWRFAAPLRAGSSREGRPRQRVAYLQDGFGYSGVSRIVSGFFGRRLPNRSTSARVYPRGSRNSWI